jgi:hypothetical protein
MNITSTELSKQANICISAARERLDRMVRLGVAKQVKGEHCGKAVVYRLDITLEEAARQSFRITKTTKVKQYKEENSFRKFCSDPFRLTTGAR